VIEVSAKSPETESEHWYDKRFGLRRRMTNGEAVLNSLALIFRGMHDSTIVDLRVSVNLMAATEVERRTLK